MSAGQMADYLSLVALADVGEPGQPFHPASIANLFVASDDDLEGLTPWDIGYLKALYGVTSAPSGTAQISRMAIHMERR